MPELFDKRDIARIEERGLTPESVNAQLERMRAGFPYLPIVRPASVGDGITTLSDDEAETYEALYVARARRLHAEKFVPASGAATRMFKELFEYEESGVATPGVRRIVENLENFAFSDRLRLGDSASGGEVVRAMLDYGAGLPKALIPFHIYPDGSRTAMEEHLVEGALYAGESGRVHIHFTVSPEHEQDFRELVARVGHRYEKAHDVKYAIVFSQQKSSTDTVAATPEGEPFRDGEGNLVFRPAGHGALIGNLNDTDADIIFVKNIDNVTPDHLKADTVLYKKALAGLMLSLQERVFDYVRMLEDKGAGTPLEEIAGFVGRELSCRLPDSFAGMDGAAKAGLLKGLLDRPLRVCAMVRNEGEPGGGPFWVANADGTQSLQIAEPPQIAPEQKHLLAEGTHFNPVDLVCGIRDHRGRRYDLSRYTDPETGLVSTKTMNGKPLVALELPGLWNGAMARWNTVFVEAPVSTFTPVKEVADLLRPEHR